MPKFESHICHRRSSKILLLNDGEAEWSKLVPVPMVELVLKLHPVQPQGMQKG